MQELYGNVKNAFKLNFLGFHAIIPLQDCSEMFFRICSHYIYNETQKKSLYYLKKKEDIILCGLQINGKIMK